MSAIPNTNNTRYSQSWVSHPVQSNILKLLQLHTHELKETLESQNQALVELKLETDNLQERINKIIKNEVNPFGVFKQMLKDNMPPDEFTYMKLINICAASENFDISEQMLENNMQRQ